MLISSSSSRLSPAHFNHPSVRGRIPHVCVCFLFTVTVKLRLVGSLSPVRAHVQRREEMESRLYPVMSPKQMQKPETSLFIQSPDSSSCFTPLVFIFIPRTPSTAQLCYVYRTLVWRFFWNLKDQNSYQKAVFSFRFTGVFHRKRRKPGSSLVSVKLEPVRCWLLV